jgi:hypothetical protein
MFIGLPIGCDARKWFGASRTRPGDTMGLLRSFFGLFDAPLVSTNPKHRHLNDYLCAETFEDKITAAEKYLGIYDPHRAEIRRTRAAQRATGRSG